MFCFCNVWMNCVFEGKAEYVGKTHPSKDRRYAWLRKSYMQLFPNEKSMVIKCDNKSAINSCSNKAFHPRTKHIDIKHYFIQEGQRWDYQAGLQRSLHSFRHTSIFFLKALTSNLVYKTYELDVEKV